MRSFREIAFRLGQEAGNLLLLARPPRAVSNTPSPLQGLPDPVAVARMLKGSVYAVEVERLADAIVAAGHDIDWRRDSVSGKSTGLDYFRLIPYLDFERAGDHKNIWDLNRHQHLVLLAQAWQLTGRAGYCREIEAQLTSWWAANPYGRGINWTSALEVAFRALSWIWIYHLAGGQLSSEVRRRLLGSLYAHGRYLELNLSVYFSPNTHLLGEAVALHAIGTLFPDYLRSARWKRKGGELVRAQMDAQVQADGSHFEQSSYYHVYAFDMLLFAAAFEEMPEDYRAKLRSMADYLDALLGPARKLPFLGDDDGGRFFHPYGPGERFGRASLAAFRRNSPEDYAEIGAWWFGGEPVEAAGFDGHSGLFENAGIAVMREGSVQVVADAGPFAGGGAGHSHSDCLSLVAGDLLVDAGTFTYVTDTKWRNWFRGSAAHNTIRIDGLDQATPVGPFRWSGKPEVSVSKWETNREWDYLDAVCKYRGFRHRRRILFLKPSWIFVLDDVEAPAGKHLLEQFWHSGERVTKISPRCFQLGASARLVLTEDAECSVGGENGWRSRVLGSKEEAAVICVAVVTGQGAVSESYARMGAVLDLSGAAEMVELTGTLLSLAGGPRVRFTKDGPVEISTAEC